MVWSPQSPMEEEPPPPTPTPPPPSSSRMALLSNLTSLGVARGGGNLRPEEALGSGASAGVGRGASFHAAVISFTTVAAVAAEARASRGGGGGSGLAGAEKAGTGSTIHSNSSIPSSGSIHISSIPSGDPVPAGAGAKRLLLEPWVAVAVQALVLLLIFLLSSLGNCAVMGVIVKHRQLRTVTNAFILSLSLSDLLTALLCLPAAFLALFTRPGGGSNGPPIARPWQRFCTASRFFGSCFGIVSILTMTLISLDRYYAIVRHPGEKIGWHRALQFLVAVWLVAVGISFPWDLIWDFKGNWDGDAQVGSRQSFHRCLYVSYPSRLGPTYNIWLIVTCYLFPFGIMCFCLCRICRTVRLSEIRVRPVTTNAHLVRFYSEMRTATTVLIMIIFIIICWGPYCLLVLFTSAAGAMDAQRPPFHPGLDTAVIWMTWANGAINPLIYAVRNPNIYILLRHKREEGYRTRNVATYLSSHRRNLESRSFANRLRERYAHRLGVCGRMSSSSNGEGGGDVAMWACRNPALLFCRDGLPDTASEVAMQSKTADTSL
ncbi:G-protein coupled receptor 135 [Monodelphis domestica]|uniref:G protein-coupled receptor 135 n=1 Tax=Monodelphis domestica TaxID=13616 RepID=F7F6Y8_MONDO|nr:G-protein coupled receptor 135 [Monodelphis domestica]